MEGKAFRAAVSKLIDNLMGKMASMEWTGKVASVEGGEVTLNAGKKTGLAVGDRLRVYGEGREVIDPDTKVSLGRRPGAEKGGIELVDFFGVAAPEAEVILDGVAQGPASAFTEDRYLKVSPGKHVLELRLPGYETYTREFYMANSLLRIEEGLIRK